METINCGLRNDLVYHPALIEEETSSQNINKERVISIKYWLALGWVLLIFYLSSQLSIGNFASPFAYFDKLAHAGEYGVLCLLLYWAFIHIPGSLWERHPVKLSILFSVLYGLSDEIHQMFVPMRTAELADLLADSAGAGLSQLGLLSVRCFKFKGKKFNRRND